MEAEQTIVSIKSKLSEEDLKFFKTLSPTMVARKLGCLKKIDKSILFKLTLEELLLLDLNLKD